jgi:Protein of unknown function (DUF2950)
MSHQKAKISLILVLLLGFTSLTLAQQPGQKTFASPEEAGQALFAAAQSGNNAALLEIFGPAGSQIISSGDEVQDQTGKDQFVAKFQEMHRFVDEPDHTTTLFIGAENWPVPIPLVDKGAAWYFDTPTAEKDILYRRIGKNEYAAMDVCQALVDAEGDFFSQSRDGRPPQYTQKFISDEGKRNGLYWKTADGEPESPIGPLVAYAAGEGYDKSQEPPNPFHGYFYRVLSGQGASAPGGKKSYIVDGAMTGGFAILAYPAVYRSSGVMTFIVGQDGVIYQKDLGPNTVELAKAMKEYVRDKTWRQAP